MNKQIQIIKPCPFCGTSDKEEQTVTREKLALCEPYQVVCSCGARGMHGDTREEAIENWNKRSGCKERN